MKKLDRKSDTLNVLDLIDADSPLAIDEVRELASALVVRTAGEKEPQWNDSAELWISAMALCVVLYGKKDESRSLQALRVLLSDPEKTKAAVGMMCKSDAWEGMMSRMGFALTRYVDRELGSTMTTTNRHLRFLDTIAVAESTRKSTFDPRRLLTGKMTIYLVLPPEHMRSQSALLRLWIGSTLRAVVRGGIQDRARVHYVMDESASLGHLEILDDAVDKFRAYGVRLQFYYQSMGQLQLCWPEGRDQTLLSNCTQIFFGVNDQQTAEYVSNRLGEETIVITSGGTGTSYSQQSGWSGGQGAMSHSGNTSYSSNTSDNWAQQARKLLKPEEVAALPQDIAVTLAPGIPPLWTRLCRSYEMDFGRPQPKFRAAAEAVVVSLVCFAVAAALAVGLTMKLDEAYSIIDPWQLEHIPNTPW
jgi:type IV secretion system protein VirD4